MIGVGGAGMSAYARAARALGASVTGSDQRESPFARALLADAILDQLHVGHAAREQFRQKDGRARSFEPQPAHMGNVGDGHRVAGNRVLVDDRRILDRHGPACEIDHPCTVCHVPVKQRGPQ